MELLRKIFRIPLFLLWFIAAPVACCLVNHGSGARRRALDWTLVWAKVTAWIFNLKIRIEGDRKSTRLNSSHGY